MSGQNQTDAAASRQRKYRVKKTRIFPVALLATVFIVALLVLGNHYYNYRVFISQLPASVRDAATFPLFMPRGVTEEFNLDKSSFSSTENALIFSVSDSSKKKLIVSEQPKPAQFSIDDFLSRRMVNPQNSFINDKRIVIGELAGVKTASFYTDTTWILVKAPDGADDATLVRFIGAMEPVN